MELDGSGDAIRDGEILINLENYTVDAFYRANWKKYLICLQKHATEDMEMNTFYFTFLQTLQNSSRKFTVSITAFTDHTHGNRKAGTREIITNALL